jgi:superfamily II RNA helicase
MDFLLKQNIDKNNFNVFIRDLSTNLNTNLKHIIEDTLKESDQKPSKYKNNKPKKPKKADLIRAEVNKKKGEQIIKDDLYKLDFLFENKVLTNPFKSLEKLKSKEGIEKMKFMLLEYYWNNHKKDHMNYIISLYYQLKDSDNNDFKELLDNIGSKLEKYEYKLYMMKELGYLLPPLNFWDTPEKKLDGWQQDVINIVNKKESCIVKAPTSAGKTWIAMSTGIIHKKILYVCPAKPVAYQVGSHFVYMGYKVHYLVDNLSHNSFDSKTNIFIGTPQEIENNLHRIGTHFDYAVFDEIHNLNKKEDGDVYENLIKILNCNFLALSATIGNIEFLKNTFNNIQPNKKIHYVEYNKRFINHQRWIYNNELESIHPLCSIDKNDLNENFIQNSLSFTPNDCSILWECIEEVYEDNDCEELIENMSPDEYFKENKLLTLDDCSDYERFLKQFLIDNKKDEKVLEILNELKVNKSNNDTKENIIKFLRNCNDKDMFPMIIFNTDSEVCKEIFYYVYENLAESEEKEYPFHYKILEKKQELYDKYLEDRNKFSNNIKISKSSTDPQTDKNTKLDNYDRKYKEKYINDVSYFYESCLNDIDRSDINKDLKRLQKNNLNKEFKKFTNNPDFCYQDVFKKHESFCFTMNEPMSGETIKGIRREIMNTLGIKIPYEHAIFQMLKRGIGLYIESMPDEYKWILQKLLSNRQIGIVISDKTLCMGIDLPVRTCCLMEFNGNNNFTNEDYLQMSGRAGRRGQDNRGNVIFYGDIDYLSLMKGYLPNITGSDKNINMNYKILSKINSTIKSDNINKIYEYFINDNRQIINNDINNDNPKLLWYFRKYINSNDFVEELEDIECHLFRNKSGSEIYILNKLYKLIDCPTIESEYKSNKIEENILNKLTIFNELYEVIINLYNNLNKDKYLLIRKELKIIYENIRTIIIKYNGF